MSFKVNLISVEFLFVRCDLVTKEEEFYECLGIMERFVDRVKCSFSIKEFVCLEFENGRDKDGVNMSLKILNQQGI